MSTLGTTAFDGDDGIQTPDWHTDPRHWCPECCCSGCGCPTGERLEAERANMSPSPWATSTRRSRLPKDWPTRRLKVKNRAKGRCQAKTHDPHCDGIGNECDHIIPGDDHSLTNLQWLSTPCHIAKTKAESAAASADRRTTFKLPPEQHPNKPARR